MEDSSRSGWTRIAGTVLVASGLATAAPAQATSGYRDAFAARYPSSRSQASAACNVCHGGSSGTLNSYGRDLRQSNAGSRDQRLAAVEGVDSDKEGSSNLIEINAGAQPGWCALAGCDNNGRTPPAGLAPLDPSTRTPPVARAGGPYSGTVNVAISFDGSGSSDPDGSVVSYQWSFGDGGGASGPLPVYAYAATGTYVVTLTVTDSDALTHSAATTAQVADGSGSQPPVARLGGPFRGTISTPLSFDGSASSDADGRIVAYAWDFGDGTQAVSDLPTATHSYARAGAYTVSLRVVDDDDQYSGVAAAAVSIRNSDRGGGGRLDFVLLAGLALCGLARWRPVGGRRVRRGSEERSADRATHHARRDPRITRSARPSAAGSTATRHRAPEPASADDPGVSSARARDTKPSLS